MVQRNNPTIREALTDDFESIWPIFNEIVSLGETFAYPVQTNKAEAYALWMTGPRKTYVVGNEGKILGTYFIRTNQRGPGAHVCNCGYMVSSEARGQGLATMMCKHSQEEAMTLGYQAMQFNFVAESNTGAISLWEHLGFKTVGRIPLGFEHPWLGFVDALVMYKWLGL